MSARASTAVALALLACRAEPFAPPAAASTGAEAAGGAGAPCPGPDRGANACAPVPGAGAAPAPAPRSASEVLRSASAVENGSRLALATAGENVVAAGATFEVELSMRADDARLVLLDARDALVPATATREVGAATLLTLAPAAPLAPGSRYALRVDGAVAREFHDAGGRAFSPLTHPLLVAGTTPSPPEPRSKPKRRGR